MEGVIFLGIPINLVRVTGVTGVTGVPEVAGVTGVTKFITGAPSFAF